MVPSWALLSSFSLNSLNSYQSSEFDSKLLTKYFQKNQYAQQLSSNWPCLCVCGKKPVLCGEVRAEPSVHTVPRGAVPACHYRGYWIHGQPASPLLQLAGCICRIGSVTAPQRKINLSIRFTIYSNKYYWDIQIGHRASLLERRKNYNFSIK